MKVFKRLSATLTAQINELVDLMENYEAVAKVSLEEMRQGLVEIRCRERQLDRELRRVEERLRNVGNEKLRWQSRAREVHVQDREKALECIRRANQLERERVSLQQQRDQYEGGLFELKKKLNDLELRFSEARSQVQILAAKEASAKAEAQSQKSSNRKGQDFPEVLSRWESQIDRYEVQELSLDARDALEEEFVREEERADLESQLDELLTDSKGQ